MSMCLIAPCSLRCFGNCGGRGGRAGRDGRAGGDDDRPSSLEPISLDMASDEASEAEVSEAELSSESLVVAVKSDDASLSSSLKGSGLRRR